VIEKTEYLGAQRLKVGEMRDPPPPPPWDISPWCMPGTVTSNQHFTAPLMLNLAIKYYYYLYCRLMKL